jgi:hypothetical protein
MKPRWREGERIGEKREAGTCLQATRPLRPCLERMDARAPPRGRTLALQRMDRRERREQKKREDKVELEQQLLLKR